MDDLQLNDRIRLREAYLDLPRGAAGVVIGFYRTSAPACAVRFDAGVRDVPLELLERAGEEE